MITIHDLAKAAEVSTATVSRALSRPDKVRLGTREKILRLAEDLGYIPDSAARNMRRKRAGKDKLHFTIAMLHSGPTIFSRSEFSLRLSAHLEYYFLQQGFAIRFYQLPQSDEELERLLSEPIDAVVCTQADEYVKQIAAEFPCVIVDAYLDKEHCSLLPDYENGICDLINRFLKRGFNKIGILSSDPKHDKREYSFTSMVARGLYSAYDKYSVDKKNVRFLGASNSSSESFSLCTTLLAEEEFDVIIASDQAMLGIYRACYEKNLIVGKDIQLVGIDGTPQTEYFSPPLSTLDVHIPELARRSVGILKDWIINDKPQQGLSLLPCSLELRQSTQLINNELNA